MASLERVKRRENGRAGRLLGLGDNRRVRPPLGNGGASSDESTGIRYQKRAEGNFGAKGCS